MQFGGPVWHASARSWTAADSLSLALRALEGAGDERLGQWVEQGNNGVVHVRRRLTPIEAARGRCELRDIRGTAEERERFSRLIHDAPHLAPLIPHHGTTL